MHGFAAGLGGGEVARDAAADVASRGNVAGVEGEAVRHEPVEDARCFGHGERFGSTGAAGEGVARERGDDEMVGEGFGGVSILDDGHDGEEFEKAS